MAKRDTAVVGAPCWVDLMTSDTERSRQFYGRLRSAGPPMSRPSSSAVTSISGKTACWSPDA